MPRAAAKPETVSPSFDCSLCPTLLPNLRTWPLFPSRGDRPATYIIGDPETNSYIVVPAQSVDVVQRVLLYFDGSHSIEWVGEHFADLEGRAINVYRLYERLAQAGLLSSPTSIQRKVSDIEAATLPLVDFSLSKVPEWAKPAIANSATVAAASSVPVLLAGIAIYIADLLTHGRIIPQPANAPVSLYLKPVCAALVFLSVVLHECSHGLAAMYFRLSVRHIRIALYLGFIPIIYLRINGLYTLRPRQRIIVWLAGPYANLAIAALISVLLYLHCVPAAAVGTLKLVLLSNETLFCLNLFPFLPTDGYYILSTLLGAHNVRSNAWQALGSLFKGRRFSARRTEILYLGATLITISTILLRRAAHGFHAGFWGAFLTCISIALFISSLVISQTQSRFAQARVFSFVLRGLTMISALLVTRVDRFLISRVKIHDLTKWLAAAVAGQRSSLALDALAFCCIVTLAVAALWLWSLRSGSAGSFVRSRHLKERI